MTTMKTASQQINQITQDIERAHQNLLVLCGLLFDGNGSMYISQDKARQIADMMLAVVPGCQEDSHFYTYCTYRIDVEDFGQLRLVFNPRYNWKEGASIMLV